MEKLMSRTALACFSILAALSACSRPIAGPRLPAAALDHAIGNVIGDPSTCVLLADPATGKTLYTYGAGFNCVRGLPICDRPGTMSATQALALAAAPGGRGASCNSTIDGSRSVGWAEGRLSTSRGMLSYSVVMEGQTALPGHEIAARLEGALRHAGL